MGRVTLKNLLAKKFRLVLTSIAVILGVAFMAGTFVLTDTLGSVFDTLFTDAAKGVDAVVRAKEPFKAQGQNPTNTRPTIPQALDAQVAKVPGVALAQGNVFEYALVLDKHGKQIQHQAPTFATGWYPEAHSVNQSLTLVAYKGRRGHQPTTSHEVALDIKTAENGGFRIGDQVTITFQTVPPQKFTLSGVTEFGGNPDGLAGATLAAFTPHRAQAVMGLTGKWDYVDVRAKPGVSQTEVRDAIRARLPEIRASLGSATTVPPLQAITGDQRAKEQANDIKSQLSFFNTFLLVFALIALFVGAFIIYNTFSITVAQRTRELGLMRALGASGRQVVASVAIEAFGVGLFSSIAGLGLGLLVVKPLEWLLSAFGIDLPSGPLQILPRTIVVSVVVGTLVTFFSALSPARRAARVAPIAALRDQAVSPSSGRRRYVWGTVLSAIGAVLLALGLFGSGDSAPLLVGVSAAVVFIGIAMLSPLIAQPAAKVLTWPAERMKSVTGMLAQQNAMRNPRRTASTAAALMIGLALVSIISIVGESAKATFARAIDDQTKTDFIMAPTNFAPFSPEAAKEVRSTFQQKFGSSGTVVEWRSGSASVNGSPTLILGLTANFRKVSDVPMRGRLDVAAFRDGGVVIRDTAADGKTCVPGNDVKAPRVPCRVGRKLPVQFPTSTKLEPVPVAGIYTDDKAVGSNTDYFVGFNPNTDQWQQRFTSSLDLFAFIRKPASASTHDVQQVLDRITKRIGGIDATNKAAFKDRQLAQFNQILGLVYVLLLFAVIIALIGIVNTLALSIYERTREIGLLRAVGMTRVQLRRMVRGEAVVVAVFGSLLGLGVGVVFGVSIVQALSSQGIVFTLPVGQLVVFVVLAGLAGLLAGTPPARRAARLDVLKAVNSE